MAHIGAMLAAGHDFSQERLSTLRGPIDSPSQGPEWGNCGLYGLPRYWRGPTPRQGPCLSAVALSAAILRSACRGHRPHVADRLHCGVKKRHASERVGMVADIAGIGTLNHDDAGVVIYGDNPNRDAGE